MQGCGPPSFSVSYSAQAVGPCNPRLTVSVHSRGLLNAHHLPTVEGQAGGHKKSLAGGQKEWVK